jgi:hypothetical protein
MAPSDTTFLSEDHASQSQDATSRTPKEDRIRKTRHAGEVSEGETVSSCGETSRGLDTALVGRPAYTMKFLAKSEVVEIVAKPQCRVTKLPEHEFGGWKGNLDPYYQTQS